jgi:hypothetical protein
MRRIYFSVGDISLKQIFFFKNRFVPSDVSDREGWILKKTAFIAVLIEYYINLRMKVNYIEIFHDQVLRRVEKGR